MGCGEMPLQIADGKKPSTADEGCAGLDAVSQAEVANSYRSYGAEKFWNLHWECKSSLGIHGGAFAHSRGTRANRISGSLRGLSKGPALHRVAMGGRMTFPMPLEVQHDPVSGAAGDAIPFQPQVAHDAEVFGGAGVKLARSH